MAAISTSQAQDFHRTFQQLKQDVVGQLGSPSPSFTDIASQMASLKSALAEILRSLSKYDQAKYTSEIAELEKRISTVRAKGNPKSKFSFKRAPASERPPVLAPVGALSAGSQDPRSVASSSLTTAGAAEAPTGSSSASRKSYTQLRSALIRAPSVGAVAGEGGYALSLEALDNCLIDLRPNPHHSAPLARPTPLTALHVKGLNRCVLIVPWDTSGSVLLHDVRESVLILGASQFRMHTSHRSVILLNVASLPIIEHCSELHFGPYPSIDDFNADVDGARSKHDQVQDFDYPASKSPNWDQFEPPPESSLVELQVLDSARLADQDVKSVVDRTLESFGITVQDA